MNLKILTLNSSHWPEVEKIYLEGIATGHATFETESPGWEGWDAVHLPSCRLIAVCNNRIAGWAALSPVSTRAVYAGVAEVSLYIGKVFKGQGIGRWLFSALIDKSEKEGIWTLQAAIFPENEASINLHKSVGFREVGKREKIGKHHGIWRDTILMERRSRKNLDKRTRGAIV